MEKLFAMYDEVENIWIQIDRLDLPENNPALRGQEAIQGYRFGPFGRFRIKATHTRFENLGWFISDAETEDDLTGLPAVVAQSDSHGKAFAILFWLIDSGKVTL
jgi:hypothetical protein